MVRKCTNYRQIRKLKSKTKLSDNRVGKQVKVKVKGDPYILTININYRVENRTVNLTLGNLIISSDTPIYFIFRF